jgi:hypothetical protein
VEEKKMLSDKNQFRSAAMWLRNLSDDALNATIRLDELAESLSTHEETAEPKSMAGVRWAIGKVLFHRDEKDLAWKALEEIYSSKEEQKKAGLYKIIELSEVPTHLDLNREIAWNVLHYQAGQGEYAVIFEDDLNLELLDEETGGDWRYQTVVDIDRLMAKIKEQEKS